MIRSEDHHFSHTNHVDHAACHLRRDLARDAELTRSRLVRILDERFRAPRLVVKLSRYEFETAILFHAQGSSPRRRLPQAVEVLDHTYSSRRSE